MTKIQFPLINSKVNPFFYLAREERTKKEKIIIIGAGITGLTLGSKLLNDGMIL